MADTAPLPRGIRNNNPGNIRLSAAAWAGRSPKQTDQNFIVFTTPEYGIRAIAVILRNYQIHYHLNTTEQIITRWAPPQENLTDAYIKAVATAVGVQSTAQIDFLSNPPVLAAFVAAIIAHENGSPRRFGRAEWYNRETIALGVAMAARAPVHQHQHRSHHHHHLAKHG